MFLEILWKKIFKISLRIPIWKAGVNVRALLLPPLKAYQNSKNSWISLANALSKKRVMMIQQFVVLFFPKISLNLLKYATNESKLWKEISKEEHITWSSQLKSLFFLKRLWYFKTTTCLKIMRISSKTVLWNCMITNLIRLFWNSPNLHWRIIVLQWHIRS